MSRTRHAPWAGQGLGRTGSEEKQGGNEKGKAFEFHVVTFSREELNWLPGIHRIRLCGGAGNPSGFPRLPDFDSRSAAGVMHGVQRLQAFPRDMGVNLGRRNVGVAEQQLHHTQIGAVVEQVGGEGVA